MKKKHSAATEKYLDSIRSILNRFSRRKVLVTGDLMYDEYIWGSCSRISPEAPVQVVRSNREERRPGGANNVVKNLLELGVKTGILGVVGNDENGRLMSEEIRSHKKIEQAVLVSDPSRVTTIKTRILAQNQQLLRLDREDVHPLNKKIEDEVINRFKKIAADYSAVILSDYDKGFFTPTIISEIIDIAHKNGLYVAVDPQVRHFKLYQNADIMTPNEKEASEGIGIERPQTEPQVRKIGNAIIEELNLKHLLITRSEKGMALFKDKRPFYIPTVAREVYDVSGAGDSVIAVYTAAIAAGAEPLEAALIANIAGGIVVGKLGTATTTRKEILENLDAQYFDIHRSPLQ